MNTFQVNTNSFMYYKDKIYTGLRNSIIHLKICDYEENLNNNYILKGYENGWNTMCSLIESISNSRAYDNWDNIMKIHNLGYL